ncbi:hypothetical protein PCLA_11f0313 [Pseudomonas citronellolis]|nr:hypothetical protein PCLA_11f0313 [Pseudomonas citronellolis]
MAPRLFASKLAPTPPPGLTGHAGPWKARCRSNRLVHCTGALFVGWVELAKPMRSLVMGIASLNPSYGCCVCRKV